MKVSNNLTFLIIESFTYFMFDSKIFFSRYIKLGSDKSRLETRSNKKGLRQCEAADLGPWQLQSPILLCRLCFFVILVILTYKNKQDMLCFSVCSALSR